MNFKTAEDLSIKDPFDISSVSGENIKFEYSSKVQRKTCVSLSIEKDDGSSWGLR